MGLGFFGKRGGGGEPLASVQGLFFFFAPTTNHALRAITPFSPPNPCRRWCQESRIFFLFWFAKSLCSSTDFFLPVSSHLEHSGISESTMSCGKVFFAYYRLPPKKSVSSVLESCADFCSFLFHFLFQPSQFS